MYLADIVLEPECQREYNSCMSYIVDCYHRMVSNRDTAYRVKQMELAGKMLDRMTELLERTGNSPQDTD